MVLMLMEDRYEKKNTMMFQKKKKKIELVFEIGLPANETQSSKTAITKCYPFFT